MTQYLAERRCRGWICAWSPIHSTGGSFPTNFLRLIRTLTDIVSKRVWCFSLEPYNNFDDEDETFDEILLTILTIIQMLVRFATTLPCHHLCSTYRNFPDCTRSCWHCNSWTVVMMIYYENDWYVVWVCWHRPRSFCEFPSNSSHRRCNLAWWSSKKAR